MSKEESMSAESFAEFCASPWPYRFGACAVRAGNQCMSEEEMIGLAESVIMLACPEERAILLRMGIVEQNPEMQREARRLGFEISAYELNDRGREVVSACESAYAQSVGRITPRTPPQSDSRFPWEAI